MLAISSDFPASILAAEMVLRAGMCWETDSQRWEGSWQHPPCSREPCHGIKKIFTCLGDLYFPHTWALWVRACSQQWGTNPKELLCLWMCVWDSFCISVRGIRESDAFYKLFGSCWFRRKLQLPGFRDCYLYMYFKQQLFLENLI